MAKTRKVILFIVEGPSDETSLGLLLTRLFRDSAVHVDVFHGDASIAGLYDDYSVDDNVVNILTEQIVDYVSTQPYNWDDIQKLVWITDTDGAYIDDKRVIASKDGQNHYCEDHIEAANVKDMLRRNKTKKINTKKLCSRSKLTHGGVSVPLESYYMSRNIEHVLHGEGGELDDDAKEELSHQFRRKYRNDLEGFCDFLREPEVAVPGNYKESWDFIFDGTHSLERHSNLHLILPEEDS